MPGATWPKNKCTLSGRGIAQCLTWSSTGTRTGKCCRLKHSGGFTSATSAFTSNGRRKTRVPSRSWRCLAPSSSGSSCATTRTSATATADKIPTPTFAAACATLTCSTRSRRTRCCPIQKSKQSPRSPTLSKNQNPSPRSPTLSKNQNPSPRSPTWSSPSSNPMQQPRSGRRRRLNAAATKRSRRQSASWTSSTLMMKRTGASSVLTLAWTRNRSATPLTATCSATRAQRSRHLSPHRTARWLRMCSTCSAVAMR